MAKEVIADVASGVGAAVAVVHPDEGAEGPGLDLALVLEHLVGLHDGHGEVTPGAPPQVPVP